MHDTEFYAYADFGRWAVTGACLCVVVCGVRRVEMEMCSDR
jgi:hypothetical protein